jgi:hypothetical protein
MVVLVFISLIYRLIFQIDCTKRSQKCTSERRQEFITTKTVAHSTVAMTIVARVMHYFIPHRIVWRPIAAKKHLSIIEDLDDRRLGSNPSTRFKGHTLTITKSRP